MLWKTRCVCPFVRRRGSSSGYCCVTSWYVKLGVVGLREEMMPHPSLNTLECSRTRIFSRRVPLESSKTVDYDSFVSLPLIPQSYESFCMLVFLVAGRLRAVDSRSQGGGASHAPGEGLVRAGKKKEEEAPPETIESEAPEHCCTLPIPCVERERRRERMRLLSGLYENAGFAACPLPDRIFDRFVSVVDSCGAT